MGNHFKVNENLYYFDDEHAAKNVFLKMATSTDPLPDFESVRDSLPEPVWDANRSAIDCYYESWASAWRNTHMPNADAGFVSPFIEAPFNGYLFMWDSAFSTMFGRYAGRFIDFQKTLDNMYSHQHRDGFICREICESEPGEQWQKDDPASTGPNILPWAEWDYYLATGDKERIEKVFDPLCAFHNWLRLNRTWKDGSYWSCGLGTGMDNCPRPETQYSEQLGHGFMSWIDTTAQAYISADILVKMGKLLGRESETEIYAREAELLKKFINENMWDDKTAYYYDIDRNGEINGIKHIGSYWTLLAGIVPDDRAERFIAHLDNENEFKRPNRVPSLSYDNPLYAPQGGYWRGSVWSPTNYMVLRALSGYGYEKLAFEIARDHLKQVHEAYDKTGTLFECYAPEYPACGDPGLGDFVGWTGLSSISMLFEYVFGIRPDAVNSRITWYVNLTDKHGIKKYPLGDATVDLIVDERASGERPVVHLKSDKPVTLEVKYDGKTDIYENVTQI